MTNYDQPNLNFSIWAQITHAWSSVPIRMCRPSKKDIQGIPVIKCESGLCVYACLDLKWSHKQ